MYWLVAAALALSVVGCGKSEAPSQPAGQPAATAGATVDPATAGSISGTVKYDGPAPKPVRLRMDADAACAKAHSSPVMFKEIETGDANALSNVVVYVKDGLGNYTFPAPTETISLDQHGCTYSPHVLAVRTGQTIEVLNSDDTTHNIHPVPATNREWNESQAPKGQKLVKNFARQEVAIPVKCNIHPWMKAYIAVIAHPYYQVTTGSGAFELKNLPPGTYTLEAWHEKLGTSTQQVTIGAQESKTVEFVFKGA